MALQNRMARELQVLQRDPPPGVRVELQGDSLVNLQAHMQGPEGSAYADGTFQIAVALPERYPFEPPVLHFRTPILHPNIDAQGRVCLDILNLPPKGAWKPSLNISTVLTSVRLLLAEPNHDDALIPELASKNGFFAKARQHTLQHARGETHTLAQSCSVLPSAACALHLSGGQEQGSTKEGASAGAACEPFLPVDQGTPAGCGEDSCMTGGAVAAAPSGVASAKPQILVMGYAEGKAAVPAAVPEGGGHAGLQQLLRPGVEHGGDSGLVKGSAAAEGRGGGGGGGQGAAGAGGTRLSAGASAGACCTEGPVLGDASCQGGEPQEGVGGPTGDAAAATQGEHPVQRCSPAAAAATAMAAAAGGQVKRTSRLALRRAGATAAEGSDRRLGDGAQAKRAKQG